MAPPVFKTGLAGNTLAGRFDSFPPPPISLDFAYLCAHIARRCPPPQDKALWTTWAAAF